jgi:dihydroorotate dehydrogenase/NAD-dependent dihydropyrimidine dehydrogenase PreA subunit
MLKNPVMPAAGPPSRDGNILLEADRGGAGCLVAKTISVKPAPVPRPNMTAIDRGMITTYEYVTMGNRLFRVSRSEVRAGGGMYNTGLWTEKSPEEWFDKEYRIARKSKLPLICSVGHTPDDMKVLMPRLVKSAHPDAVEFFTHYIKPGLIAEIVKTIKKFYKGPVFAKLSPHAPETLISQAKEAEDAGAEGIVAINSFGPTLHFDIDTCTPFLGSQYGFGWISGPPVKPLAIRCVFDLARNVKIPVIGVGGISSGRDAIEHIMAGATAVQVCTAAIYEGPKVYGRIVKEMAEWMERNGYKSLDEIRGLYLRKIGREGQKVRTSGGRSKIDEKLCKGCHTCETSCVYGAISFTWKDPLYETAVIDEKKCMACGLCVSLCPVKAPAIVW